MLQKFSALVRMLTVAVPTAAMSTTLALAQTPAPAATPFTLTSPRLQDGASLDKRFAGPAACGGDNVSLPLQWSNAPPNTRSFAVILYDFDAGRGFGVVHWIAYGIAPDVTSLAEGEGTNPSPHLVGGSNTRKSGTYYGPCGPATDTPHHYLYTVYALDVPKDELPAGLTRDQFLDKVKGRVLNQVTLVATYKRPK